MATSLEIIVGTYEEFLLGYRVRPSRSNDRKYDLFQSFSTHSHTSSIRTVASYRGIAASGGADDRICLYDLKNRKEMEDLHFLHNGTINTLAFVPDGSYLISGGSDGKMALTKTSNWKVEKIFERAHKGAAVNFISIHPSGKLALSIGSDLTLRTWNLINGRQAFATSLKNKSFGNNIDFVMWSKTGGYFAIAGKDTVEVWDTNQASVISTKKCEARPSALCWISDSDILVGMENGKMMFFNWEDENQEAKICEIYESRIKAMKFVNGFLATCSSAGELNLWVITVGDTIEMEMVAGIEVGCRLICLDIVEIEISEEVEPDIKDEINEEKKTKVRQLESGRGNVIVEVEQEDEFKKSVGKKRKAIKKSLNKIKKKRISNGFLEEDC